MSVCITEYLYKLLDFAEDKNLICAEDRAYFLNRLLECFKLDAPECAAPERIDSPATATMILDELLALAVENDLLIDSGEQRDLFSAKVMGILTPAPSEIRARFNEIYESAGSRAALTYFYELCRNCDYIRVDRISKNVRFMHPSRVGELEITINLSKPEKDPRDIAAQKAVKQTGYPRCMLCVENPGYAGRVGFPARQNHRILPLKLAGESWYLQYSPYAYYDEHCIVLNKNHVPMKICRETFVRLLDFVEQFPEYFLGSNADLPIVGGSILSHDHFQGGGYTFPMDRAAVRIPLTAPDSLVEAYVADWPLSCIVLKSKDREALVQAADNMLTAWRGWTDEACDIYSETIGTPHNTITPIARMEGDTYKLFLVLRNNRTTEEHPLGLFHPHAHLHHVKKENIGLIEVMGLFILPGRLVSELSGLEPYLTGQRPISDRPADSDPLHKHYAWVCALAMQYGTNLSAGDARAILRSALADKCAQVLIDAGVYPDTPTGNAGVLRFLNALGYSEA